MKALIEKQADGYTVSITDDGKQVVIASPAGTSQAKIIDLKKYNDQPKYFRDAAARLNVKDTSGLWASGKSGHKSGIVRIRDIGTACAELLAMQADLLAAESAAEAEAAERRKLIVRITLSTRGWGDYSSLEWSGNITRPDSEILAECRAELNAGHDVDQRNQSDADLLAKITAARAKWQADQQPKPASKPINPGPGYCYSCETYCYGDCGDYQPRPTTATLMRDVDLAHREANYGIED
jgi:hypothetical protein